MAQLDINKTTTTNLDSAISDFTADSAKIDQATGKETTYQHTDASTYLNYYKTIPELKKAIDALAIWTVGKGWKADDTTKVILESLKGWGEDTFQSLMENIIVQKKIFGDAYAEIMRDDSGRLINFKPLYAGDMMIVVDEGGFIKRYEQRQGNKPVKKFNPNDIFHTCNDRIANEIHGISVIEACKWVIDARNEAMRDYRKVLHRNVVPVRIIEVDTDNTAKRNALISEYEDAIKKGEVLVIPKGTVKIQDTTISIQDPTTWISYLENFFYQAVGVPRVIATSQEYSEASSKVGYLTFEPIYTREQALLEADIYNQLGFRVEFNRPVSLGGFLQESEKKNTGQTGFQPNDAEASIGRTE